MHREKENEEVVTLGTSVGIVYLPRSSKIYGTGMRVVCKSCSDSFLLQLSAAFGGIFCCRSVTQNYGMWCLSIRAFWLLSIRKRSIR